MSAQTLNPDWAKLPIFDRSRWKRLRFGEFAQSVNARVNPGEAVEDIYVGLEHLDPQNLHIRRWGKGRDVIGTKLRFRKGDIIFGRRRAYQRKLAVAEFDGICSAHSMVVRAKPEIVLPEFLPFLMMSDRFMNRAIDISVGSLSPTINWTTLKMEEFALPPLDQQRLIAEILWAVDEVLTNLETVLQANDDFAAAIRNEVASGGYPKKRLEEIATLITKGESPRWQGFEYQDDGAVFITSENVLFGCYQSEPRKHIPLEFHRKLYRSELQRGDVLFNLVGASIGRGCVLPEIGKKANVNQAVAVVRLDVNTAKPEFILSYLLSQRGLRAILGSVVNTARANVSLASLRKTWIPVPPLPVQSDICNRLSELDQVRTLIRANMKSLHSTCDAFFTEVLR